MSDFHRIRQVVRYGWMHAGQISEKEFVGKKRLSLFLDIFSCYRKYGMWSNQYLKERYWELDKQRKDEVAKRYSEENQKHEEWVKDFFENRKFLAKWSRYDIESNAKKRERRNKAYIKHYGMGSGCVVEYGVELSRQHHLPGTIRIGSHVTLAKNMFIDYSGDVIIEDNVRLANGVIIESHHRDLDAYDEGKDVNIPTRLLIRVNAMIGSRAIILDSCNYIGRNARIGAGAVVTSDIPDYSLAVGVPAKVKRIVNQENTPPHATTTCEIINLNKLMLAHDRQRYAA